MTREREYSDTEILIDAYRKRSNYSVKRLLDRIGMSYPTYATRLKKPATWRQDELGELYIALNMNREERDDFQESIYSSYLRERI